MSNNNDNLDLTTIRHRLAPKEKLTAMEEWRRLNRRAELREWLWAAGVTGLLIAGLAYMVS